MNNQWFSKVAVWLVIALVLFTVFNQFNRTASAGGQIGYSDFLEEVRSKRIAQVTLQESGSGATEIRAQTTDGKTLRTTATYLDRGLVGDLINNSVKFDVKPREEQSILTSILLNWGPMLLLIGVWIYFMRQMQGAFFLACSNMSRTRAAPTPTNISTKSEPEMLKNGTLARRRSPWRAASCRSPAGRRAARRAGCARPASGTSAGPSGSRPVP